MNKGWWTAVLAAVCGVALALVVAQAMLVHAAAQRLQAYGDQVFDQAMAVVRTSREAARRAELAGHAPCSDEDLKELRYLVIQAAPLADLGRVADGHLLCSAEWGRLSPPARLPPPQLERTDDSSFWRQAQSVNDARLHMDMVRLGRVLTVTSPLAFQAFAQPQAGHSALVLRRADHYVFQSFGDTTDLARQLDAPPPGFWAPRRTVVHCASMPDLCVVAALAGVGIAWQPAWLVLLTMAVGALTGASLGFAGLLYGRSRASLPQQIRRAVHEGRLYVVYQPLVRIRDGHMVGVEVLARLKDARGTPIAPDVFIPIAEQTGLIATLTRQVVRRALSELRERLTGPEDFYVSINLAASDVIDASLHAELQAEAARLGVPAARVVLEITERSTAAHGDLVAGMQALRQQGYRFFIDDFGTGYSSLAYLSRLPIAGIKLDRMFTQAIGQQAVSSVIVEKVCSVTRRLGVQLVVEGIETAEQAAHVLDLNPEVIGQGWWFGRPVAAADLGAPAPAVVQPLPDPVI